MTIDWSPNQQPFLGKLNLAHRISEVNGHQIIYSDGTAYCVMCESTAHADEWCFEHAPVAMKLYLYADASRGRCSDTCQLEQRITEIIQPKIGKPLDKGVEKQIEKELEDIPLDIRVDL